MNNEFTEIIDIEQATTDFHNSKEPAHKESLALS